LLTVQELADLLQIPPKTIYTWRYKGIGPPAVPMGKYLRFRAEDVAAWLDARADAPPSGLGRRSQLGSRVAGEPDDSVADSIGAGGRTGRGDHGDGEYQDESR
jgi:excisionase family DNA binding protein